MTEYDDYVARRSREGRRRSRQRYLGWCLIIAGFTIITVAVLATAS